MIDRNEYFTKLLGFKDKKIIKVITGIRRCGKSTLLLMFQEYLLKNGIDKTQVVSINFEDYDNEDLRNPKKLHDYIKERLLADKMVYVFLTRFKMLMISKRLLIRFF